MDPLSLHAACPVVIGEKWGMFISAYMLIEYTESGKSKPLCNSLY